MVDKKIIVTGATGFVGQAFLKAAHEAGIGKLICFTTQPQHLISDSLKNLAQWITVDYLDQAVMEAALVDSAPDAIVHIAGAVRGTPKQLFESNTLVSVVLCEAIQRVCPEAIVTHIGSAAEYGYPAIGNDGVRLRIDDDTPYKPVGAYGHSKAAASAYFRDAEKRGLALNIVKPFNLIAPNNSPNQVVGSFFDKLKKSAENNDENGLQVSMGHLGAVRDFITLRDLVSCLIHLVRTGAASHTINACSGEGHCIRDMLVRVCERNDLAVSIGEPNQGMEHGNDVIVGCPNRFKDTLPNRQLISIDDVLDQSLKIALNSQK